MITPAHPFWLYWVAVQLAHGRPPGCYPPKYEHHLRWHAACVLGGQIQDQTAGEMLMLLGIAVS